MNECPPPFIETARVLEYTIIDPSVIFTGYFVIFVDGKLLGRVPRLAICQEITDGEILLFHCDEQWGKLAVTGAETTTIAKEEAERGYRGLSRSWVASPYSDEDVSLYIEERWAGLRCSFCRNWHWQYERLYTGSSVGVSICNVCIELFHSDLGRDPESSDYEPIRTFRGELWKKNQDQSES